VLRESIASIDRERAPIGKKITELRQKLYKKAEDKTLERQAWEKFDGVLKMLAGVACLVPVGQPFVRLATDTASKLTKAVADVDRDPKKPIDIRPVMTNADELFKALKEAVNENGDADDSSKSLLSRVDTTGVVDQFLDGLKPFLVNADEIDAEINDAFAKLEDADPDITDIKNRVSALQSARKDLVGELILQSSAIQKARTAIRKKQQMIDTARAQKENVSARLNPALKVLARQMQQEAMDGINQYLYYLAKAYEFHALKAAPLAESMNNMAEELTRLFADPGADTAWSESDFNGKIGKILDNRFGKILDTIRNEMVRGYQERAARGKDVLTMTCKGKPVFDALYAELCKTGNAEATFRPEDIGYAYARGQGNTRIANVVLKGIQFDRENDTPLPTTMSVELSHSGVSILRAGKTAPQYAFVATGAVKWGANCSFKAVKGGDCEIVINPFGPSEGDKELWKALKLPEQLSLYCPAFHAPLTLKIQTLPKGSQVRIKELELDFSLEV
jgi:predicted  nucleic acid-binding Zn-ribbon protein